LIKSFFSLLLFYKQTQYHR